MCLATLRSKISKMLSEYSLVITDLDGKQISKELLLGCHWVEVQ